MSVAEIRRPLRIGPRCNGMEMTPEEFDAHNDWMRGYRYELVHGVLIVNPPADVSERNPNHQLGYWLRAYRETHPQGSALDDTSPEHTIPTSAGRRRVDRVIWAGLGRTPDYDHDIPAIAIEFVSDRRRDRRRDYETKRDEYEEAGVQEYWVIDRFQRDMTVFRATGRTKIVKAGDVDTTSLLPGFELPLKKLLEIADRCTRPPRARRRTQRRRRQDDA
jgi:Uma2 family endonuclease